MNTYKTKRLETELLIIEKETSLLIGKMMQISRLNYHIILIPIIEAKDMYQKQ